MNLLKTKLTVGEVYSLEAELNGVMNQKTKEVILKGLLNEEMSISTKYWLNRLNDKVGSIKKTTDTLREELFKKHGEENEKKELTVRTQIEKTDAKGKVIKEKGNPVMIPNPAYEKFNEEIKELFEQEHEIEHAAFDIEKFNIGSSVNYAMFYKILGTCVEAAEA